MKDSLVDYLKENSFPASGTIEKLGDEEKPVQLNNTNINQYCTNNGKIAFVIPGGVVYIGRNTREFVEKLESAGYTPGFFHVPHSNGSSFDLKQIEVSKKLF